MALRPPTQCDRRNKIQLKRVLEIVGMMDHRDFAEQESPATGDRRPRPELILRLPGEMFISAALRRDAAGRQASKDAVP